MGKFVDYNLKELVGEPVIKSDTAIALIAYDRIGYFQEVVDALLKNPAVRDAKFPVYAFIDVNPEDNGNMVEEHVDLLKKKIPHAVCIKRKINYGCGRNIIDARVQLLSNMDYQWAFIFEDDMVPSPSYIQFCLNVRDWVQENYDDVGIIQGWNKCLLDAKEKKAQIATIGPGFANLWGYLMSRKCWQSLQPYVLDYQRLFLRTTYRLRSDKKIRAWFQGLLASGCTTRSEDERAFPVTEEHIRKTERFWDTPATGQDALTLCTLQKTGWRFLYPIVNRGLYIGREGIHMLPASYENHGYGKMTCDELSADVDRREFIPLGQAPSRET
jgi:hypothetical protein